MPPRKVKKVMTLPINVIFGHLQVRLYVDVSYNIIYYMFCFYPVYCVHIFILCMHSLMRYISSLGYIHHSMECYIILLAPFITACNSLTSYTHIHLLFTYHIHYNNIYHTEKDKGENLTIRRYTYGN